MESGLGGNISSGLTSTIDHCCQLYPYQVTYINGGNYDFDRHRKEEEYPFDTLQTYYQHFTRTGTHL